MNPTKQIYFRVVFSLLLAVLPAVVVLPQNATQQPVISARVASVLQVNGLLFKDLNKNGKLDVYEDWRRPI
jgi:beta-glucosidase